MDITEHSRRAAASGDIRIYSQGGHPGIYGGLISSYTAKSAAFAKEGNLANINGTGGYYKEFY